MNFLLDSANLPFLVAIGLMLAIALLEGVGLLFGLGFSELIDSLIPDLDLEVDVDVDLDAGTDLPDVEGPAPLSRLLGWLRLGKVPALILLVVFLTSFGLLGFGVQAGADSLLGGLLPRWLASLIAFALAIPCLRLFGGLLGRLLPGDESSAISREDFVGRIAVVTQAVARRGLPAEARFTDEHGQTHYILVEPDDDAEAYERGTQVLIISGEGTRFRCIRDTDSL